jgi:hypothetical protein
MHFFVAVLQSGSANLTLSTDIILEAVKSTPKIPPVLVRPPTAKKQFSIK